MEARWKKYWLPAIHGLTLRCSQNQDSEALIKSGLIAKAFSKVANWAWTWVSYAKLCMLKVCWWEILTLGNNHKQSIFVSCGDRSWMFLRVYYCFQVLNLATCYVRFLGECNVVFQVSLQCFKIHMFFLRFLARPTKPCVTVMIAWQHICHCNHHQTSPEFGVSVLQWCMESMESMECPWLDTSTVRHGARVKRVMLCMICMALEQHRTAMFSVGALALVPWMMAPSVSLTSWWSTSAAQWPSILVPEKANT
jgi:hypothetical protein